LAGSDFDFVNRAEAEVKSCGNSMMNDGKTVKTGQNPPSDFGRIFRFGRFLRFGRFWRFGRF